MPKHMEIKIIREAGLIALKFYNVHSSTTWTLLGKDFSKLLMVCRFKIFVVIMSSIVHCLALYDHKPSKCFLATISSKCIHDSTLLNFKGKSSGWEPQIGTATNLKNGMAQ